MYSLRAFLAVWLGVSLCLSGSDCWGGSNVPVGILPVAFQGAFESGGGNARRIAVR